MAAGDPLNSDAGLPSLRDVERRHIQHVLDSVAWNKKRTARILKINRGTLYRKIAEYRLARQPASRPVGVDPIRTLATDTDHDQRDTGPAKDETKTIGEPRLPREIAEHKDGRTGDEGGANNDGRGSGPS